MATRLKPVDVVLVGMGFTASILARELLPDGLSIVGLERGVRRDTVPDWQSPAMHDELRYSIRNELFQNMAIEAFTFRNNTDQEALPIRVLSSFLPGTDLGGAGVHWNGQTWRFLPSDFNMRSHYTEKYGAEAIPDEVTIQDWGVKYDELEPHFDRFEYLCGIAGKAGNLGGQIQPAATRSRASSEPAPMSRGCSSTATGGAPPASSTLMRRVGRSSSPRNSSSCAPTR